MATRYPRNRFRQYRLKRRMTQLEVAARLGHASGNRLSAWEGGSASHAAGNILALAQVYGITVEKLLGMADRTPKGRKILPRREGRAQPRSGELSVDEQLRELAEIIVDLYLDERAAAGGGKQTSH